MSLIYGLEVFYSEDGWPSAHPDRHLTREQIEKLEPIDLLNNKAFVQMLEQMDIIEKDFGMIHGYLNYQGILNNAVRIRGNEIFMDMYDDPEFVHRFFRHIAGTIMNVSKFIQERQRKSGFDINLLSMSNCVMNMVSPSAYKDFVLPYEIMLSKEYDRFGVHTCNWDVSPYIDILRFIDKMGYLDMGIMSDLKRVKEIFPDTRRAVMYNPVALEENYLEDIRKDIQKIYDEIAPCDIVMADVENTTPDSRVIEFLNIVEDILNNR